MKKLILEGRGFRGGSDEKIRRMWLGPEIVVEKIIGKVTSSIRNIPSTELPTY